jgi:putative ABC transport system permease protein
MNSFILLIKNSIDDFKRSKVRTFLTSLGILIGVLSVVLLIALGLGLKNYIQSQFESLGSNLVYVFPGQIFRGGRFRNSEGIGVDSIRFDEKDVRNIEKISYAAAVVPAYSQSVKVEAHGKQEFGDLYASNEKIFDVRNLKVEAGAVFTSSDVGKRSKLAVMGPKIAEKIFEDKNIAIGKYIRLNGQRFKVIGVIQAKGGGGFGGPDFDSYIYVPYTAATSFNPKKQFALILIQAKSEESLIALKDELKKILLKRYDEADFTVTEQKEILDIVSQIFSIINSVLVAIGSISLIVGGIGIMNIMYATVTERTKEIGIRRAIGATKRDILLQFLSESAILSVFGGLMGLIIAFSIVTLVSPIFPASINFGAVAIALLISSGIGIFFGVFPARRAANLSPVDAIRYE